MQRSAYRRTISEKYTVVYIAIIYLKGNHKHASNTPVNRKDGSQWSSAEEVLQYQSVLNHSQGCHYPSLRAAAHSTVAESNTNTDPPTIEEVQRVIKKLKNEKAAELNGIPPDMLKKGLMLISEGLHQLLLIVWKSGKVTSEWRYVLLYKGKCPMSECESYRLISLLSVSGRVFMHVLLERLRFLLTERSRPQRSDFTAGRSTKDAIHALRLLSEIHREFGKPPHFAHIDIKSAFDSVDRNFLWGKKSLLQTYL